MKKYDLFPAKFAGIDSWGRVVFFWEEKGLYLKTIALEDQVLANTDHSKEISLYSVAAAYDDEEGGFEGEPDKELLLKVFPVIKDNGETALLCYKKQRS